MDLPTSPEHAKWTPKNDGHRERLRQKRFGRTNPKPFHLETLGNGATLNQLLTAAQKLLAEG